MTDERLVNSVLDAFLADGSDEAPDRVIDAALDEIGRTRQRRVLRLPRRFTAMKRYASAAAVLIVLVTAGGTLFLMGTGPSGIGGPRASTPATATPSARTVATAVPSAAPAAPSAPTVASPAASAPIALPRAWVWSATGEMTTGRFGHSATLLRDGRVLVAGGRSSYGDGTGLSSAELYDPLSGSWTPTEDMLDVRPDPHAIALHDGTVLVVGEGSELVWNPFLQTWTGEVGAELYDPLTGSWTATGPMAMPDDYFSATRLSDGRVLVAGRGGSEVYDPESRSWSRTGEMITPRYNHAATLLRDGRVLVAGGEIPPRDVGIVSSELYDPATGTWSATADSPGVPRGRSGILLPDGRVLDAGAPRSGSTVVDVYDPDSGTWASIDIERPRPPYLGEPVQLLDGSVLFLDQRATVVYEPTDGAWSAGGSLLDWRIFPSSTVLTDGRVLVAGGHGPGPFSETTVAYSSAELYGPPVE